MKHQCKITVLKRPYFPEVAESFGYGVGGPCDFYYDGQEFLVDEENYATMLDGKFCSEAWAAIGHYTDTILQGGIFPTDSGENYKIACCPNGIRPVIFKIELVKEEANSEQ